MTTITHSEMVKQLAKSGSDIISELTPSSAHLLHMAVGISGESAEILEAVIMSKGKIDRENLVEEFGDYEFYIQGLRQEIGFKREDTLPDLNEIPKDLIKFEDDKMLAVLDFAQLSMESGILLDVIKKFAIYTKKFDTEKAMEILLNIELTLETARQRSDISYEECIEYNINKLGKRYKGHNYSNEQANDRADKK